MVSRGWGWASVKSLIQGPARDRRVSNPHGRCRSLASAFHDVTNCQLELRHSGSTRARTPCLFDIRVRNGLPRMCRSSGPLRPVRLLTVPEGRFDNKPFTAPSLSEARAQCSPPGLRRFPLAGRPARSAPGPASFRHGQTRSLVPRVVLRRNTVGGRFFIR
jgi:hypothetical protein